MTPEERKELHNEIEAFLSKNAFGVLVHLWKGLAALAVFSGLLGFVAAGVASIAGVQQLFKPAADAALQAGRAVGKAEDAQKRAEEALLQMQSLARDAENGATHVRNSLATVQGLPEIVAEKWPEVARKVIDFIDKDPLRFGLGLDVAVVTGTASPTADDATSEATCVDGHSLVGCMCYSNYLNCDGAMVANGKCIAQNGRTGTSVTAYALCARLKAGGGA